MLMFYICCCFSICKWQADTWRKLGSRLRQGGRIIANLGGPTHSSGGDVSSPTELADNPGEMAKERALKAISEAFPGEVSSQPAF